MFGETKSVSGAYLGNSSNALSSTSRVSELEQVLNKLKERVGLAREVFTGLEGRLQPILRSPNPEAVSAEKEVGYSTNLAQEINSRVQELDSLINYIAGTSNRIEL